jgi:penicillin-binding protein 1A
MVEMMQGVVQGGGTATGANAGGHPLAGKTGTVNNETDVWFIGYTPTYVTGVWMGNPERKVSLGAGMTGGHGAVPYFNAFMVPFMKDKPRERFPDPPPMPSDIKTLAERNKREELEKLSEADAKARLAGVAPTTTKAEVADPALLPPDKPVETPETSGAASKPDTTKPDDPVPVVKRPEPKPPAVEPKPEDPKPAGEKRKGKKGDG